jgi:hypothetical protein
VNLDQLTAEDFMPCHGQTFTVQRKGIALAQLRLEQIFVSQITHSQFRQQFSLYLKALGMAAFPDGLFTLYHPQLGEIKSVYINRVIPDQPMDQTPCYQISFN